MQAEESRRKAARHRNLRRDSRPSIPHYAAAYINLGTIYFHLRQFDRAEELYRRATEADPGLRAGLSSISATCSTSWSGSTSPSPRTARLSSLSPGYADAHYNLALAYERSGQQRPALRHWRAYVKLDNHGPWADHARGQIRKLLSREKLAIVSRAGHFIAPRKGKQPRLATLRPLAPCSTHA